MARLSKRTIGMMFPAAVFALALIFDISVRWGGDDEPVQDTQADVAQAKNLPRDIGPGLRLLSLHRMEGPVLREIVEAAGAGSAAEVTGLLRERVCAEPYYLEFLRSGGQAVEIEVVDRTGRSMARERVLPDACSRR